MAATSGQVLKWNGSAWAPATDSSNTYTAGTGVAINSGAISATDASTSAKGIVQLAGDISGTATSVTVSKIQGNAVATTAPVDGQVLTWDNAASNWKPATPISVLSVGALQTGNYTALASDVVIQGNITAPGLTITLPTSGIPAGKVYYITNKGTQDWAISPALATAGVGFVGAGFGVTLIWTGTEWISPSGY